MRLLILGASGLIGHKLLLKLSIDFDVYGILHKSKENYGSIKLFAGQKIIDKVDVSDFGSICGILEVINPDVILNCVGITLRKDEINDPFKAIKINALFPHQLANWAKANNKRVIHFSTDCVFNGSTGNYTENSLTTAENIYGRTKALGEINYDHTLTIRSSFIGQELFGKTELLDWFLQQDGKQIKGFTNTLYSGVSTNFMAYIVKTIILDFPKLSGLYQLATEKPISKYELLCIAKKAFEIGVEIIPDDKQVHKPTLNGSKLNDKIKIEVPSWEEMMNDIALNKEFYTNNEFETLE
jgi:dTDP-4-dehydrorhamnose reductase